VKRINILLCLVAVSALFTGCCYDVPVFVTVETSETPFLIKLEGGNETATLKSQEMLKKQQVATKRIQVSYRWVSTGYSPTTGKFVPNERVIVVDRAPVTREWHKEKGKAIWVESSDSVGFSTGISITARIEDNDDATTFLYNYPPDESASRVVTNTGMYKDDYRVGVSGLAGVMDEEVRTKVQEVFAEKAAEYTMDDLRPKKNEIIQAIRDEVTPFFAERGITITAIGMFGGFEYENQAIQESIDKVFQAQQDEEVAKAEAKAAEERKLALKLIGEGEASGAIEVAKGRAESLKLEADAEAAAIQAVADAKEYELKKLTANPEAYMALKKIEVDMERLKVWDGKYPVYYLGGGEGGDNLNMFLPAPKVSSTQR